MDRTEDGTKLLRVLEALNSGLNFRQVAYRLVDAAQELMDADHVVILEVSGSRLLPTAAAARQPNVELFRLFRNMTPIDVSDIEGGEQLLAPNGVVFIPDARTSPLVPAEWAETFHTRSVALIGLRDADEIAGVLAVSYRVRHEFTPEELRLLEAMAHAVRVAMGHVRLEKAIARTTELQRALLDGLTALVTSDLDEALEMLTDRVSSVFGGSACSIVLTPDGDDGPHRLPATGGWTTFPLRVKNRTFGYLRLDTPAGLDGIETRAVEGLALEAAVAAERDALARTLTGRAQRIEALYRLSTLMTRSDDLPVILGRMNKDVLRSLGFECLEAAFRRRAVADLLGCRLLDRHEVSSLSRLRVDGVTIERIDPNGVHAATIPVAGRAAGLLYVRPVTANFLSSEDQEIALSLATAIGELASRRRLSEALNRAERRAELDLVRHRLARRVNDTVGQTLKAIWEEVAEMLTRHNDIPELTQALGALRRRVSQALGEAQTTAESLAVIQVRVDGLQAALRSLLQSFSETTGVPATFRLKGTPVKLPLFAEETLYMIAFQILSTVEGGARASTVTATLEYGDEVTVAFRDDGIGLSQRDGEMAPPGIHHALNLVREYAARLGATLEMRACEPRGYLLEVRAPKLDKLSIETADPAAPTMRRLQPDPRGPSLE